MAHGRGRRSVRKSVGPRLIRRYRYVQADVFTSRPFGGNQLAVFTDARGLSDAEMQAIAREMAFSETTFVLPATRPEASRRVRIFTPSVEMPMAGHPTVGTAWVLARRGDLPLPEAILELGIGPVTVRVEDDFVWMTHRPAEFGTVRTDPAAVAKALAISPDDVDPRWPIQTVSTGFPFLLVPVRSLAAIARCRSDADALGALFRQEPPVSVYPFTTETVSPQATLHSRMFSPHVAGVVEDPATGSAAAPMGAYAVKHGLVPGAPRTRLVIEQGLEMHRPSEIHVDVRRNGDEVAELRIGGQTVIVGEGELIWSS